MKLNKAGLKSLILEEMNKMKSECGDMGMPHDHDMEDSQPQHSLLMPAVLDLAGGCPIKAKVLVQGLLSDLEGMQPDMMDTEEDMPVDSLPNPATSGVIPSGDELMGDEIAYMEQKKPTGVKGPGHSVGIFGPGFR